MKPKNSLRPTSVWAQNVMVSLYHIEKLFYRFLKGVQFPFVNTSVMHFFILVPWKNQNLDEKSIPNFKR